MTIISHTDHGTSVLPQSTAERLMKEIKLEVTQKISQNENQKLGSLKDSKTPTLLDAIHQNVLSKEDEIELGYIWILTAYNFMNQDMVFLSYKLRGLLINIQQQTVKELTVEGSIVNNIFSP